MTLPSFPNVDLFSAGINALNGVLIARNPSHNRGYAAVGLLIMAFFGGIGGGITRDVLLNEIPSPLKDPMYPLVCVLMGVLGLVIYLWADSKEEQFRTRTLAYFKSFSLPWFAILGAHKALEHDLGFVAAMMVGLVATTAGGVFIDLFSGVTPEIVRPSEHLVTTAILASAVYATLARADAGFRVLSRNAHFGARRFCLPGARRQGALEADRAIRGARRRPESSRVNPPPNTSTPFEKVTPWTTCGCGSQRRWPPGSAGR